MSTAIKGRHARQADLVPTEGLLLTHAVIVGVGAVGRQVALQLAATGVGSMSLVDFDLVEEENLGPQAYFAHNCGTLKVECTRQLCMNLNPALCGEDFPERFRRSRVKDYAYEDRDVVVFCCVDNMESRRLVWETMREVASLFVDGRCAGETVRVLASSSPKTDEGYEKTLFADEEAFHGSCTSKITVYLASLCASLMVNQFSRKLRNGPVDADVLFNLKTMELGAT